MHELSRQPTRWKLALAALTTACAYNAVSLWRVSRPHAAATLVSPWVAPGDDIHLDLVFERDPEASSKGEVEERVIRPADGASYSVRFNDSELLAMVLAALVPARGEIELVIDLGEQRLEYAIKDAACAAEFVSAFRAAQRAGLTGAAREASATG